MQEPMPSPHPTWPVALERYFAFRAKRNLRDRTRREERRILNECRARLTQSIVPHDLTEEDLEGLFQQLRAKGLAAKTQTQYATALRSLLGYLGAPAEKWVPSFPVGEGGEEGRYLSDEERGQLWAACRTPEDELILALGLGAGWRRSDGLGAVLADFAPSSEAPTTVTVHGKGEKYTPRSLELHPKIREVLPRYLVYRTAQVARALHKVPSSTDRGHLLLAVSWGTGLGPMRPTTFDRRISAIYERAMVDAGGWPSHNLRRTWADNRLEALTRHYESMGTSPALTLEMAMRQVCWEGRWKDEKTLRQSYLKRRMAPTAEAWALTKV